MSYQQDIDQLNKHNQAQMNSILYRIRYARIESINCSIIWISDNMLDCEVFVTELGKSIKAKLIEPIESRNTSLHVRVGDTVRVSYSGDGDNAIVKSRVVEQQKEQAKEQSFKRHVNINSGVATA